MCIIAIKPKGSDFIPIDIIRNCCDNNPDGFSMAWNEDGKVNTFKTMDRNEAIARYHTLSTRLDPAETAFMLHARIATHGSKKIENCHCWSYLDSLAFAHNGILTNVKNRDDMTDSETFLRDYFIPTLEGCGIEIAFKITEAILGGSNNKFAFIDFDGKLKLMGNFLKGEFAGCKGKCYFSNHSYAPRMLYGNDMMGSLSRPGYPRGVQYNPYGEAYRADSSGLIGRSPTAAEKKPTKRRKGGVGDPQLFKENSR